MWWVKALQPEEVKHIETALFYLRHSRRKHKNHDLLIALAKSVIIATKAIEVADRELKQKDLQITLKDIEFWSENIY